MIEGVNIKQLRRIPDERGTIMKMQEASDPEFKGFGEVYFSKVYPGVVKGWHCHPKAWLNFCVVSGTIKLVLFDDRENSSTRGELQEVFVGVDNYCLVQIPPGVWNGFKGAGSVEAIVCDLIDHTHADDHVERLDPHDNDTIPYDWSRKDR
ncbi:MAG TPA: dTDP-4-dehydrorhamnose 3,5-epimerase family protein [Coriobacteriia bacterium]